MGMGILVCGLNGVGKSTLGKALAQRCGFYFIDNEDLYFSKTDPQHPYTASRTREQAEKLLLDEMRAHENFVFASVKGDYGKEASSFFHYAVLIDVPREIRLERVKNRSFQKFGDRMLPGGNLYEKEKKFFDFVGSRPEDTVEVWLKSMHCPVIRVDGTKSVLENVERIVQKLKIALPGG